MKFGYRMKGSGDLFWCRFHLFLARLLNLVWTRTSTAAAGGSSQIYGKLGDRWSRLILVKQHFINWSA